MGRVSGAPVILAPSWFLAAVVLTVLFAPTVRSMAPQLDGRIYLLSFAFVLLLFVSVFCHEVAHAVVARARGQRVTELALTLWGGHTAYTGSAGRPLDGLLIAVVGPVTNLVLGGGFWVVAEQLPAYSTGAALAYAAAFSNAFVGLFNLLPGLPLDGGQILESIVWAITRSRTTGTIAAGYIGRIVAAGFVAVVAWRMFSSLSHGQSPDYVLIVWTVVIGGFLWSGAGQAIRVARSRAVVSTLSVASLTRPAVVVPETSSVGEAGAVVAAAGGPDVFAVVTDAYGRPTACVDNAAAAAVPVQSMASTPISSVVVALPDGTVDLDMDGPAMLSRLADLDPGYPLVAVLSERRVVGVLEISRVLAALNAARR